MVFFPSKEDALAAIDNYNGAKIDGRPITLILERTLSSSSNSNSGGGGGGGSFRRSSSSARAPASTGLVVSARVSEPRYIDYIYIITITIYTPIPLIDCCSRCCCCCCCCCLFNDVVL